MRTNHPIYLALTGLLAAAACLTQTNSPGAIIGPYAPDPDTLHLWHMDAAAVPVPDEVSSGGTNLVGLLNGATLGNASFTGFGSALSTLDGGQDGTAAANRDALLTPSTASTPGNVVVTVADPVTGAFTFEAIVWIGFDPAKNFATTAAGGNGRNAPCNILSGESSANANRIFQFRLAPVGTIAGVTSPAVTFENVRAISGNQPTIYCLIPTNGPDAILSNNWYHVAVTYNGSPSTADNIKFYWTLLDPSRTAANKLTIASATTSLTGLNPLSTITTPLIVGNDGRNRNSNFMGLVDEVRISKVERDALHMMFTSSALSLVTQPQSQFVGVGDTVQLTALASGASPRYQWQFNGADVANATNATLTLTNITFSQAGAYRVRVSSGASSLLSDTATIKVGAPFVELFNTGVSETGTLLSGGDVDPHWFLIGSDDPNYPGPADIVVGSPPGSYAVNGPKSMWLAPVSTGSAAQGFYTNLTRFLLDTISPTDAVLFGSCGSDNGITDVLLNGVSVGLTQSGFSVLTPFTLSDGAVHTVDDGFGNQVSITNHFVAGLNTLVFVVSNAPSTGANPTGFRVELRGLGLPLSGAAPALITAPVNVTTQQLQTATFQVVAAGTGPLAYQWYHGATALPGQTNRTLRLNDVTAADAGTYSVTIANDLGQTNAAATLTVISPPLLAWLGGDASYPQAWDSTTLNWRNTSTAATVPFAAGNDVVFDSRGSSQPNVDLAESLTPNVVTVDSATDYTLMSSSGMGALAGNARLIKKNTGTLIVDTVNSNSGPTTILGGTLQVGNNDFNGALGSGAISDNAALVFARADTFSVPNSISGTGTVTMAGSGSLGLSGNNAYSGSTVVAAGTLVVRNATALGSTNGGTTVDAGAQLYIFGDVNVGAEPLKLAGAGPGNGALRKASGGGTVFGGAVTLTSDATISLDANATLNLTNAAGVTGANLNLSLNADSGGSGVVAGPISLGTGFLDKEGAGTWTLTGTNNAWSGGTTINGGTLQIGDGGTNGSLGSGPIQINGVLTFNSARSFTLNHSLADNGGLTFAGSGNVTVSSPIDGSGSVTNRGSGVVSLTATNTYSGATTISGAGVIRASVNSALGDVGTCFIGAAQTDTSRLELVGGITLNNPIAIFPRAFGSLNNPADILNVSGTNRLVLPASIQVGSGGNLLSLQSDSGKLIIAGGITANGVGRHLVLKGAGEGEIQGNLDQLGANSQFIWKLDSGKWTLAGVNTPGAATTISNGVLELTGSLANVLTNAGGTLSGNGFISGPVYIASTGRLAPGVGLGTLTISNDLVLQPGSFTVMELNKAAGTHDLVAGVSNLTYNGTLVLTNLGGSLALGDAFKLFDALSYTGNFAALSPSTPGSGLAWDTSSLATDGTLRIVTGVAQNRTNLTAVVTGSGGSLQLSWPADHLGWTLQVQTNSLNTGLSTNWFAVPGSAATNQVFLPINRASGTVFYRLVYP